MSVSMRPFLTCFFGISFLAGYLYLVLYRLDHPPVYGAKMIFPGLPLPFSECAFPSISLHLHHIFAEAPSAFGRYFLQEYRRIRL